MPRSQVSSETFLVPRAVFQSDFASVDGQIPGIGHRVADHLAITLDFLLAIVDGRRRRRLRGGRCGRCRRGGRSCCGSCSDRGGSGRSRRLRSGCCCSLLIGLVHLADVFLVSFRGALGALRAGHPAIDSDRHCGDHRSGKNAMGHQQSVLPGLNFSTLAFPIYISRRIDRPTACRKSVSFRVDLFPRDANRRLLLDAHSFQSA